MSRTLRSHRSIIAAAAAAGVGMTAAGTSLAGPVAGSDLPVATEQPSLGVTYLIRTEDLTNVADLGQVIMFAGNFAPNGYSFASGQLESIAANQVLFSRLGTTYGGNGANTFALPNLSGRTVVGTGAGAGLTNRALGSVAGATTQTLTANQLPPFGGASGITTGSQPLPTTQPSIALNQTVVTQGIYPQHDGPTAQGPVIGQVLTYAGAALPNGQMAANGQQLAISQNQALFSILGANYGGPNSFTFALPNLAGRAATEAGAAPGRTPQALGQTVGAENTVLRVANLPPQPLTLPNGSRSILGGGQPVSVQDPTLGLHYIIAEQGVFPTQGGTELDGPPILGEISLFAGTFAPAGWAFADGQTLLISQNAALFAVLGNTYGGNGISTFALPDLRGRVAVGTGDGVTLGGTFGADNETLNFAQLPQNYPAVLPASNVPEPSALAIILTGLAALVFWRRGRHAAPIPVR